MARKAPSNGEHRQLDKLEIDEDLGFEHHEWRLQRVLWAGLTLIVLAALVGLVGSGPLSSARQEAPGGSLALEYPRFLRAGIDVPFVLDIAPGAPSDTLKIWFDRDHLEGFEIQEIMPAAVSQHLFENRVVFLFLRDPARPARIILTTRASRAGLRRGRVGIVGGAEVAITEVVYP
jgi:hypothetical protein